MTHKQVKLYVGAQLKERRVLSGLRQEDVAKVLRLSRVSVLNIEAGRLFNCTPNEIFPPIETMRIVIEEKMVTVKKKKKVLRIVK